MKTQYPVLATSAALFALLVPSMPQAAVLQPMLLLKSAPNVCEPSGSTPWTIEGRKITSDKAKVIAVSTDLRRVAYTVRQGGVDIVYIDGVKAGLKSDLTDLTFTADGKSWYARRNGAMLVDGLEVQTPLAGNLPKEIMLFYLHFAVLENPSSGRHVSPTQCLQAMVKAGICSVESIFSYLKMGYQMRTDEFGNAMQGTERPYRPTIAEFSEKGGITHLDYQYLSGTVDSILVKITVAFPDVTERGGTLTRVDSMMLSVFMGNVQAGVLEPLSPNSGHPLAYTLWVDRETGLLSVFQAGRVTKTDVVTNPRSGGPPQAYDVSLFDANSRIGLAYNVNGAARVWAGGATREYSDFAFSGLEPSGVAFRDSGELAVAKIEKGGRKYLQVGSSSYPNLSATGPSLFDQAGKAVVPIRTRSGPQGYVDESLSKEVVHEGSDAYLPNWTFSDSSRRYGFAMPVSAGSDASDRTSVRVFDCYSRNWSRIPLSTTSKHWVVFDPPSEARHARSPKPEVNGAWLRGVAVMVGPDVFRFLAKNEADELYVFTMSRSSKGESLGAPPITNSVKKRIWLADIDSALADAKKAGQNTLIFFSWPVDRYDQQMRRSLESPALLELISRYVWVRFEVKDDQNSRKQVQRFKIDGTPAILLLDSNGKEIKRVIGARTAEELIKIFGG